MKLRYLIILVCLFTFFDLKVNAKEIFYVNDYKVEFSENEFNFITKMFYEGYQNLITITDYNNIFNEKYDLSDIVTKSYEPYIGITSFSNSHSTASKRITISKACSMNCLITINVEWLKSAKVRSYDVIGAYLKNTELTLAPTTTADTSTEVNSSNETVLNSNGFGTSIKLPTSGSDINVVQYFKVKSGGTVYGSYQHATSSISLSNSKKYTISRSGYGGVFLFDNPINAIYDGMGGVDINT